MARNLIVNLLVVALAAFAGSAHAEFKKGSKLQTLVNLHPDFNRGLVYSTNYQLPGLIPVCANVEVTKVSKKKFAFSWEGREFTLVYDKHTRGAGVSFDTVIGEFFGPACDAKKIASLSKADRDGIKKGLPAVGMTRQGVLYTMGRPPHHANPSLEVSEWMYWMNKFKRKAIEFNGNKVSRVRL